MSISDTSVFALIPFEVEVQMHTFMISRISPTSALINVEVGGNRSKLVKVHNVPESSLNQIDLDGRITRPIFIGAHDANEGAILILKRMRIDNFEYHLTS